MSLNFSDLFSGSAAGLTGDLGIAGVGLGIAGAIGGIVTGEEEAKLQSQAAQLSAQNAQLGLQINTKKTQQMYLNSQRSQMENLRNTQRAAAMGKAAAASQGGIYGSGYGGGQATAKETGATNQLNTSQNLGIGSAIAGYTQQQGQNNIQIAQLQGQAATLQGQGAIFQGLGGMGGGLLGGAKVFGNLFGNIS